MREIKFKCWDSVIKRWLSEDDMPICGDGRSIILEFGDWDGLTFCQFTGLSDSKGVEIYEGTVLKSGTRTGVVIFDKGSFMISRTKSRIRGTLCYFINDGVEIIGNIYENSELVDKESM